MKHIKGFYKSFKSIIEDKGNTDNEHRVFQQIPILKNQQFIYLVNTEKNYDKRIEHPEN
jgi:hypothetical protein